MVSHTSHGTVPADFLEARRTIYDHELVLHRGTSFTVEIEGIECSCRPDSFIIIPPGRMHVQRNVGGEPGHRYWCHFDWIHRPGYADTPVMTFAPGEPLFHLCRPAPEFVPDGILSGPIPDPLRAYELFERLSDIMNDTSGNRGLIARGTLIELLISLLVDECDELSGSPPTGPRTALASRIRGLLDAAVYRSPPDGSPQEILAELGYRYEHLCRLFRATYGVPPLRYLNARRIVRAQSLLRDTRLTAAEVAYKTGFRSPSHFTRTFRGMTGCTPAAYRRQR